MTSRKLQTHPRNTHLRFSRESSVTLNASNRSLLCFRILICKPYCLQNSEDTGTLCSVQAYRESPFKKLRTGCSIQGYRESPFKKLRAHDEFAILDVVVDKPLTHLKEVQQHLLQTTGTDVCIATLCNFIAKCWIYLKQVNIKGPTNELGQHTQATRVLG